MSNEGKELMDPSLFAQLLENQRRELTLKEKEIDLEREKIRAAQKSDERASSCSSSSSLPLPRFLSMRWGTKRNRWLSRFSRSLLMEDRSVSVGMRGGVTNETMMVKNGASKGPVCVK